MVHYVINRCSCPSHSPWVFARCLPGLPLNCSEGVQPAVPAAAKTAVMSRRGTRTSSTTAAGQLLKHPLPRPPPKLVKTLCSHPHPTHTSQSAMDLNPMRSPVLLCRAPVGKLPAHLMAVT
jgi:hypothetical protein